MSNSTIDRSGFAEPLALNEFKPKQKKSAETTRNSKTTQTNDPIQSAIVAQKAGFSPREGGTIDGRAFRRKNRHKQLTARFTPEFHQQLLKQSRDDGYPSIGEFIEMLFENYMKSKE